jgi:hypothetical protein
MALGTAIRVVLRRGWGMPGRCSALQHEPMPTRWCQVRAVATQTGSPAAGCEQHATTAAASSCSLQSHYTALLQDGTLKVRVGCANPGKP